MLNIVIDIMFYALIHLLSQKLFGEIKQIVSKVS